VAITSAFCTAAKLDALQLAFPSGHTYKLALYTSSATLDASTTGYSSTNEVAGAGYTAGGATLSGYSASSSGTTAWLTFSSPSWASSTITARGAVLYDDSHASKRALAVFDFGGDKTSTSGTFTVTMPTADATNALIRVQ
jgi:hypothetical protein